MKGHKKMLPSLLWVAYVFFVTTFAIAPQPLASTPVEHESRWWPKGQGEGLGTVSYPPSKKERPFFNRLSAEEVITGSFVDGYDISAKDKKYVGWFGIVRKIDEDSGANRTTLTVEHKYFDGLTDIHLQAVSFNGAGDFHAILTGTGHRIPPLSLVKVYGIVTKGQEGTLPRIDAVFVRNWHWGTFTFLAAYGAQHGSAEWRKLNQVPLDEIYEAWPHPCHQYYEKRLGMRADAAEIHKRLLDAAGPLSAEACQAMDRLADLLALGHTWSEGETIRQSAELGQICALAKKTGSQKAAIKLLLQALHENDERVSWSASEKFAAFDPAGEVIGDLVKLLDDKSPRVRAGAARAFSWPYSGKAVPAVAALSRCVAETDHDLKLYAVLALSDIGRSAKAAVPALKSALADGDQGICVEVAKALWRIDQEPNDVIPVLTAVLENGDNEERYNAAEQLKEMGPWAAPAVPALIKALKDEDSSSRGNAAEALGEVGPKAATAISALTEVLQTDGDSYVRAHVAETLGKIGDPKAIPILIATMDSQDDHVRLMAIHALEAFGRNAKAAVPALVRAVESGEENGWAAAGALGAIDADGVSAPVLIEALGNSSSQTRRFAAMGLSRMGRKAGGAAKALQDGLRDTDPGARIAAATAYWSVSGEADEPVRVLRSVIQAKVAWYVQMWAANSLAEIGPAGKAAVPELIACLKSDAQFVVTASVEALGKIGPDAASAVPALTAKLEGSDDHTRMCIVRALWRINHSEESLPLLQEALKNSSDAMALIEAAAAIGEMGPQAKGSAPLLVPLLKDSDSFVRDAAAKALEQIERK